jgi:hypothetical protein
VENIQYIDLEVYKREVEDYIYVRTGYKIKVVFDDMQMMRRHFQMLCHAYDMAVNYKKSKS